MRPQSFQNLVLRLAAEDPATGQTRTLKDAGDSKHPYGFAVATGGREARFQITVKSVPGEDYEQPETSHPAEGDPAARGRARGVARRAPRLIREPADRRDRAMVPAGEPGRPQERTHGPLP